ncbi:MAG: acyl-ACP--UDP-N-acetylglucosamine O-acyltransferase [Beijerinckiaceae bacterium]
MAASIHPTAIVDARAEIGESVIIGPFCIVGPDARLAGKVELVSHVVVAGRTSIGENTRIYPFASIGHPPQDLKYRGEPSTLSIGKNCQIREGVTMNPGTEGGGMKTVVGDNCLFLANSHVGHDSEVGDHVIFSNNVLLGGHCKIGEYAIIGGGAAIAQFVRIGQHAFASGLAGIRRDVIPYGSVIGIPAHLNGLNIIGLKRRGFSREAIHDLRRAYRLLFAEEGTLQERVEDVTSDFRDHPVVHEIVDFIREGGDRAFTLPKEDETDQ